MRPIYGSHNKPRTAGPYGDIGQSSSQSNQEEHHMKLIKTGAAFLAIGTLFASGFLGVLVLGGAAQAEEGETRIGAAFKSMFGGEGMHERLAQKLGVTPDQLRQAMQEVREEMLTEAVAAGRLTQEQADRMRSGTFGMGQGMRGGRHGSMQGFGGTINLHEVVAQTLGITTEQLRAELRSGKTLLQAASERGMNRDQLVNTLLTAQRGQIAQAVAEGRITQEMADRITETLQSRIEAMVDGSGSPRGGGPGFQMHRMGR
jgi:plasmid maintenance system antidote protein VapI